MENSTTDVVRGPQPAAGERTSSMPPVAHCVAFCGAFGLVFAVSGAVLLYSGFPYRRFQLRVISACMLVVGVTLLAAAVVLIFLWHNRHQFADMPLMGLRRQRPPALVIRVPTISGSHEHASTPAATGDGTSPSRPPAYDDVVLPPPSYESVMMYKRLERAAAVAPQIAESACRNSAPGAGGT
ncbi:hypothetical protein HPB50_028723 [Hyalomma asiaticum]|nr:hypothetical protein HPB50_028723 [Hyalomma asiaticum]